MTIALMVANHIQTSRVGSVEVTKGQIHLFVQMMPLIYYYVS